MSDKAFKERRLYPRADIDFRGILDTADNDRINLRACNISASGVYLFADKKLAEFTEVSLLVLLPALNKGRPLSFRLTGVIVRVDERSGDNAWPYGVAVHFTAIEENQRQSIREYVEGVGSGR